MQTTENKQWQDEQGGEIPPGRRFVPQGSTCKPAE